jgi:hypothetical protein
MVYITRDRGRIIQYKSALFKHSFIPVMGLWLHPTVQQFSVQTVTFIFPEKGGAGLANYSVTVLYSKTVTQLYSL